MGGHPSADPMCCFGDSRKVRLLLDWIHGQYVPDDPKSTARCIDVWRERSIKRRCRSAFRARFTGRIRLAFALLVALLTVVTFTSAGQYVHVSPGLELYCE
jgi:hypothetical protein